MFLILIIREDEMNVKLNINLHYFRFININCSDLTPIPFPKMQGELFLEYGESSALTIFGWLPPLFLHPPAEGAQDKN
jgi:hypothetical protein